MNRFLRFLLPLATAATAFGLAAPGIALAGTYNISTLTSSDVSGWSFTHADLGFSGCSRLQYPGVRGAADVARPTPLRIFGSGAVTGGGVGLWTWLAPPTTTILRGTVEVSYRTTAPGTSVYLKARTRSQQFEATPRRSENTGDGTGTWPIPANTAAIALALRSADKRTYGDKWANTLRIASISMTLSDTTAPTVTVAGALTAGKWLNQAQPVCLTATAQDAGAGIAAVELDDATGRALDGYHVPVQSATQPGVTSLTHDLCVAPSSLGEGSHGLKLVVRDAAGETTTTPIAVMVDSLAPVAKDMAPADRTTDLRPAVSFTVEPGPSGLSQLSADLDGTPMDVTGTRASLQPVANLALGVHTVQWSATDGAGNSAHGQWSFTIASVLPNSIDLRGPRRITAGQTAHLSFNLGTSFGGLRLLLQARVGSTAYSAGRELTVPASGSGTVSVRPTQTTTYRLTVVANPGVHSSTTVAVVQPLRLASQARYLHLGHALRLTPWVRGRHGVFRVNVELHTRSGWIVIGRPRINTTLKVRPLARGRYLFRAVGPKQGNVIARASHTVVVNVI